MERNGINGQEETEDQDMHDLRLLTGERAFDIFFAGLCAFAALVGFGLGLNWHATILLLLAGRGLFTGLKRSSNPEHPLERMLIRLENRRQKLKKEKCDSEAERRRQEEWHDRLQGNSRVLGAMEDRLELRKLLQGAEAKSLAEQRRKQELKSKRLDEQRRKQEQRTKYLKEWMFQLRAESESLRKQSQRQEREAERLREHCLLQEREAERRNAATATGDNNKGDKQS